MGQSSNISSFWKTFPALEIFAELHGELKTALYEYWNIAEKIVTTENIKLRKPPEDYVSIERNFFSLLFLYSYYRAGISPEKRKFYGVINHCIRGMVTGCDNLLDDEYKKTLDTSLPENGFRFRSVLDIMASDRILFEFLCNQYQAGKLSMDAVKLSSSLTLKCLLQSGAQEASEEQGVSSFLRPENVLSDVHHYKTGVLFQSPWAVPALLEPVDESMQKTLLTALYNIGIGCQILDDMVDLQSDICLKKNNYVASVIVHLTPDGNPNRLRNKAQQGKLKDSSFLSGFPIGQKIASVSALEYLNKGFDVLFAAEHAMAKDIAITFVVNRIGAGPFLVPEC